MTEGEEQETAAIEHLQCGDVGSGLMVGGKVPCPKKATFFPCVSEKGANFMVEGS